MISVDSKHLSGKISPSKTMIVSMLTIGMTVFSMVNQQNTAQAVIFYSNLPSSSSIPIINPESSSILEAEADFQVSGNQLIVTLTNTSTDDVRTASDVLTAIFFRIKANPILTRESATLANGSTILFPPIPPAPATDPSNGVGSEWAYKRLSTSFKANQGISSTGFGGKFKPGERFLLDANLQGNVNGNLNGLEYGITSAGDDPATGDLEITGENALIKNSVQFVLSNLPSGFTEEGIGRVYFQYGTSLSGPRIQGLELDEPSTNKALPVLVIGMLGVGWIIRKRPLTIE